MDDKGITEENGPSSPRDESVRLADRTGIQRSTSNPPPQSYGAAGVQHSTDSDSASLNVEASALSVERSPEKPPAPLDLNELQKRSSDELKSLAREFDLHLHPARSSHQHI